MDSLKLQLEEKKIKDNIAKIVTDDLDPLKQGVMVVIDLLPENSSWYKLPFVVAEIDSDLSYLNTTLAETEFSVQA